MIRLTHSDTAFTLTIPANALGVLCDLAGICHDGRLYVFVAGKSKKPQPRLAKKTARKARRKR